MKNVAFIGLGYIGLPTAVVMANSGLNVCGVDVIPEKVEAINNGVVTITEPGLEAELQKAIASGNFHASTEMPKADAYVIAVPTPFTDGHQIDRRYINAAAEAIAPKLKGGEVVILESTSPPRTTEKMAETILRLRPDLQADSEESADSNRTIFFAHCPERILPGNALQELRSNDRIIGGMTQKATKRAKEIYSSFCRGELLETNDRTAEMAKLTENSFRDVNIAFANELSTICEELSISVWELIELANHHPRVNILQPGPGVGGHCIAVDPWFIVSTAPEQARLIKTAREVNDSKPEWVLQKIGHAIDAHPLVDTIAILGLSFKADIDDLRESPALSIAEQVACRWDTRDVLVVEPNINQLPPRLEKLKHTRLVDVDEVANSADLIVLLVDHAEFKNLDPSIFTDAYVIDTKGLWG